MPPIPPSAFDHPSKECDVIMKGGITSGVVYPRAVTELAQTYRLRNVGGTSAGAIAAALAAAAEHGRGAGGFQKLAAIPDFLAANLTSLFQPAPAARPAFEILLAGISPGGKLKKGLIMLGKLVRFHGLAFLIGALFGLGLFWLVADFPSNGQLIRSRAMPLRILSMLIWGLVAALTSFVLSALRAIQGNAFGMCSGMPAYKNNTVPALTPWMADRLDDMAGKTGGPPLTFGDLWGPSPAGGDPEQDPSLRAISLEVMTTNLTHGRPVRLPTSSREFFFDPQELRRFFPEEIVKWMEDHPFPPRDAEEEAFIGRIVAETPCRPMPAPADLPVVVATRMSLSFPVLISAIPLYAIDWSLKRNQEARDAGKAPSLGRCWFSDGGIGSNFPVHFFDGLLPSRPTFGINLRPFHPDHPKETNEANNVRFPIRAGQGIAPTWTAIDGLVPFITAIINTMQNWVDNNQMRLPGYRDRVVHVHLTPDEGGLNLVMPEDRIKALTARGEAAGKALQTINWNGHRWTRYLSAVSQLQDKLDRMEKVYSGGFDRFLADHDPKQVPYRRTLSWKTQALQATAALMNVVRGWRTDDPKLRMDFDPPRPAPDLRVTPKL